MINIDINALDLFYISYDEPFAEEFWARLRLIAPWAKRVHGVKGFDAAHKKCAEMSETEYFITVDGDNILDPEFLDLSLSMPNNYSDCVLSWTSVNAINGLAYGNGGVKMWPREQTRVMKTHEAATEPRLALDFCWDDKYIQMNNVYSTTHPDGSPFQAFRAGYREGVKMTIHSGQSIAPNKLEKELHQKNMKRLLIWMSVGADNRNGLWAMLGSRMGLIDANLTKGFDLNVVRDYDWFRKYWTEEVWHGYKMVESDGGGFDPKDSRQYAAIRLSDHLEDVGYYIKTNTGLKTAVLTADQSAFFKAVYEPPKRTSALRTEIEVDSGAT